MKAFRYLKMNSRQRIEHNLVLERMGELSIRDFRVLTRSLLYGVATGPIAANVFEGFVPSVGAGLSANFSTPMVAVANSGNNDDVMLCVDGGAIKNVIFTAADPTDPRVDIVVARQKIVDAFLDTAAYQADPTTFTVTAQSFYRDKDMQIELMAIAGKPCS